MRKLIVATVAKRVAPGPKVRLLGLLLGAGLGMGLNATAQNAQAVPASAASTPAAAAAANGQTAARQLVKPGDRMCLQHTGSLIPPKKGECLPVTGRSYSGKELQNTGAIDNAHALQMLDPSITLGH